MMYNVSSEGDSFIAYHNTKLMDTADDSTWHNARSANPLAPIVRNKVIPVSIGSLTCMGT